MGARRSWIIGYDIASPRRLRRVARVLEKHAVRIQYSLFVATMTEPAFDRLWRTLAGLINPRADDVRAWPVPEAPLIETWGRGLPPGIVLGDHRSLGLADLVGSPRAAGLLVSGRDDRV
jgi:CRISPR-associated protein Cas2